MLLYFTLFHYCRMAEALSPKRPLPSDSQALSPIKKLKAESPVVSISSATLQNSLEELIAKLNKDREKDQLNVDEMKSRYEELCAIQMESFNEKLQTAYQNNDDPINQKIQILNEKFEQIRKSSF